MCRKVLEDPSQLIPHGLEESIELLWSVDLDMGDIFCRVCNVEPFRLGKVEDRHGCTKFGHWHTEILYVNG